jgi:hypothetical protein
MCLTARITIPSSINEVFNDVDIRSMIFNIKADALVKERELKEFEEWCDGDEGCYCEECCYCIDGTSRLVWTFIDPEDECYGGPGDGIGICKKCDATEDWKKEFPDWYPEEKEEDCECGGDCETCDICGDPHKCAYCGLCACSTNSCE